MYAVGVGKAVEDELREIASEPVEKHFYYTTDFTAISTIAENLKLNVCPGNVLVLDQDLDLDLDLQTENSKLTIFT